MKIEILLKGNTKVFSDVEEYAKKRIEKILSYFDEKEVKNAVVSLTDLPQFKKVEMNVVTSKQKIRAEEKGKTFHEATDLCYDKLQRQITKYRDKLTDHLKKESLSKMRNDTKLDINALEKEVIATQLVKNKKIELKPMNEEEAIIAMNLIDHDFYIYYDIDRDKTCVLYRREDKNIALIETTLDK